MGKQVCEEESQVIWLLGILEGVEEKERKTILYLSEVDDIYMLQQRKKQAKMLEEKTDKGTI